MCKALKYYWEYMLLKNRDDFSRYKRWSKSTIYDSWNYAMLLLKYDTALLQQPLGVEALGALQFSTFGFNSCLLLGFSWKMNFYDEPFLPMVSSKKIIDLNLSHSLHHSPSSKLFVGTFSGYDKWCKISMRLLHESRLF